MVNEIFKKEIKKQNQLIKEVEENGYRIQGCALCDVTKCYFSVGNPPESHVAGYIDYLTGQIIYY